MALGVGAFLVVSGGNDDNEDESANDSDSEQESASSSDGLGSALSDVIDEAGLSDDCPLIDSDDLAFVLGDLGEATDVSSGPDDVTLDDGATPSVYCNVLTDNGLVSMSAALTSLSAEDFLDESIGLFEAAADATLTPVTGDAPVAAEAGTVAGTCLSDSEQLGDQCRYAWTDGTVQLSFADVTADLDPELAFEILDRFVATALDRFGE